MAGSTWFGSPFFGGDGASNPPFDASAVLFWQFKVGSPGAQISQISLSAQWQKVLVAGEMADGTPLSASEIYAAGVQIAFKQTGQPQSGDWHDMRVENRQEGAIYAPAYILVGPQSEDGGDVVGLGPGTYQRFVRVKTAPHSVYLLEPLTVKGPNL